MKDDSIQSYKCFIIDIMKNGIPIIVNVFQFKKENTSQLL
jgi:hypothetical protein